MMDIEEIKRIIPHRYPFLLVDRVIECDLETRIVALKNVTTNEPFFQGHFPEFPVMPGVLIIEAMAQAACILALKILKKEGHASVFFTGIDAAKFRKPRGPRRPAPAGVDENQTKRNPVPVSRPGPCRRRTGRRVHPSGHAWQDRERRTGLVTLAAANAVLRKEPGRRCHFHPFPRTTNVTIHKTAEIHPRRSLGPMFR